MTSVTSDSRFVPIWVSDTTFKAAAPKRGPTTHTKKLQVPAALGAPQSAWILIGWLPAKVKAIKKRSARLNILFAIEAAYPQPATQSVIGQFPESVEAVLEL